MFMKRNYGLWILIIFMFFIMIFKFLMHSLSCILYSKSLFETLCATYSFGMGVTSFNVCVFYGIVFCVHVYGNNICEKNILNKQIRYLRMPRLFILLGFCIINFLLYCYIAFYYMQPFPFLNSDIFVIFIFFPFFLQTCIIIPKDIQKKFFMMAFADIGVASIYFYQAITSCVLIKILFS